REEGDEGGARTVGGLVAMASLVDATRSSMEGDAGGAQRGERHWRRGRVRPSGGCGCGCGCANGSTIGAGLQRA
ncbi:unnamed protein product, partial [Urochloa humidicola]